VDVRYLYSFLRTTRSSTADLIQLLTSTKLKCPVGLETEVDVKEEGEKGVKEEGCAQCCKRPAFRLTKEERNTATIIYTSKGILWDDGKLECVVVMYTMSSSNKKLDMIPTEPTRLVISKVTKIGIHMVPIKYTNN